MSDIDDLTVKSFLKLLTNDQKNRVHEILNSEINTAKLYFVVTKHDYESYKSNKTLYHYYCASDPDVKYDYYTKKLAQYKYRTKDDLAQQIINDRRHYGLINIVFCLKCKDATLYETDYLCACKGYCVDYGEDCNCKCNCANCTVNRNDMTNLDADIDYDNVLFGYNSPLYNIWSKIKFNSMKTNKIINSLCCALSDFEKDYFIEIVDIFVNRELLDSIYKEIGYDKLIDHLISISTIPRIVYDTDSAEYYRIRL